LVLDLGPEDGGGTVVATGTPEDIALDSNSYTGRFLKPVLQRQKTLSEGRVAWR